MNIDFITIGTNKMEESISFYTEVLGFKLLQRFSPRAKVVLAFLEDSRGCKIELMQRGDEEKVDYSDCQLSLTFKVDNIDEVYNYLTSKEVEIISNPFELPSKIKLMQARDPNGLTLGFVEDNSGETQV